MRIKHKVNLKVAEDTDMKDLLFGFDDTLAEVVIDTYDRVVSGKLVVEPSDDDPPAAEEIPLGDIGAVKGIFLKVDQACSITINEGDTPIVMARAGTGSTDYAKLFLEADIEKVEILSPAEETTTVFYCIWGTDAAS